MPGKSYVSLELIVGVRRAIPWEYASRPCTVLDDDDRIDARSARLFAVQSGSDLGFRFSSSSSKNLKRSKQVRRAAVSPDLSYMYLFCVLHATDDDHPVFTFSNDASNSLTCLIADLVIAIELTLKNICALKRQTSVRDAQIRLRHRVTSNGPQKRNFVRNTFKNLKSRLNRYPKP